MADNLEDSIEMSADELENLNKASGEALAASQKLDMSAGNFAKSAGSLSEAAQAGFQKIISGIRGASEGNKEFAVSAEKTGKAVDGSFSGAKKSVVGFNAMVSNLAQEFKGMTDALGRGAAGVGGIIEAKMTQKLVEFVGNKTMINEVQESVMGLQKASLQIGTAFGKSFGEASGSTENFMRAMVNTSRTTLASRDDFLKTTKALSEGFDASAMMSQLKGLGEAQGDLRSEFNLTNAAILTAAATGMDHAAVAGIMTKAHLELGAKTQDVAGTIGVISDAAKDSGLKFEKVAGAITGAADKLKMWGGTVNSVAPVFKAFSQSLEEGRKGLAPQLLQEYTAGLEKMSLGMRGLIGMQAGMGEGMGAIGAGLEMEVALEDKTGEGMKKITEGLSATLKQFGGGEVVTREEAIADPALQRNFLVQRQLLEKQLGVSTASATQMLNMLADIDKHGMEVGADGMKEMEKLMGKGEDVQEATTTDMVAAERRTTQAIVDSRKVLVDIRQGLARRGGAGLLERAGRASQAIQRNPRQAANIMRNLVRGQTRQQAIAATRPQPVAVPRSGRRTRGATRVQEQLKAGMAPPAARTVRGRQRESVEAVSAGGADAGIRTIQSNIEQATETWKRAAMSGRHGQRAQRAAQAGRVPQRVQQRIVERETRGLQRRRHSLERAQARGVRDPGTEKELASLREVLNKVQFGGAPAPGMVSPSRTDAAIEEAMKNIETKKDTMPEESGLKVEDIREIVGQPGKVKEEPGEPVSALATKDPRLAPTAKDFMEAGLPAKPRIPLGGAQAEGLAREQVARSPGRRDELPVERAADAATATREREEHTKLKVKSDPLEQEIHWKIKTDKNTIVIEPDDEAIKSIVRAMIATETSTQ